MAIHITRRELKIKSRLLIALVLILGIMSLLYLIFCKGKGYNEVKINLPEAVTEESTTKPVSDSENKEDESKNEGESEPEQSSEDISEEEPETPSKPHVSWESYDPIEVLSGENWALALINKEHPIGKDYVPNLSPVIDGSMVTADSRVSEAYKNMYNAAKAQDIILAPYSGYISYYRQQENYNNLVSNFKEQGMSDEEAASLASARIDMPGCGESGAGLSVDIIGTSNDFDKTKEYEWLAKNAYKYGFIQRYTEDKFAVTGVKARPWHWRYVGVDAAAEMKNGNLCLEEYLEKNN